MSDDRTKHDDGPYGPNFIWGVVALGLVLFAGLKYWQSSQATLDPMAMLRFEGREGQPPQWVTEQDCKRDHDGLWIATTDFVECIAYVIVKGSQPSDAALLFFNGDVPNKDLGKEHLPTRRDGEQAAAAALVRKFDETTIVLGRPGLMGSTGFHQAGGMRDDAYVMAMAVDALKVKFGLKRLAMAGQSGGSRLIAQMMVLGRTDIVCAAMASGAYDTPTLVGGGAVRTNIFGQAWRRYLVPMHETEKLQIMRDQRIFVIGDRQDSRTPFGEQRAWFDRLVALGHRALLIEAEGRGDEHHGLTGPALTAAALCLAGKSDAEIKAAIKPVP